MVISPNLSQLFKKSGRDTSRGLNLFDEVLYNRRWVK